MVYPRRWLYQQTVGKVSNGKILGHVCRIRNCVNPKLVNKNRLAGKGAGRLKQLSPGRRSLPGFEVTIEAKMVTKTGFCKMV